VSRARATAGEAARRRHGWLELLQVSGPFLTLPVVDRLFPTGVPAVPVRDRAGVRALLADLLARDGAPRQHTVEWVLRELLGWRDLVLLGTEVPAALAEAVPEHGDVVHPHVALAAPPDAEHDATDDTAGSTSPYRLLGTLSPWGTHPLTRTAESGWSASAVERLAVLLRARDVPVGVTTDGRWWALVWAPRGGTTGAAVWDGSVFSEEPDSLAAFVALLHRRRFFGVAPAETLPALLVASQEAQEEVTESLGRQVREAVELLVRTLDQLDHDSGGALLGDVSDDELYEGAVTVLMRVVFLLFAEDRRLLPSDDEVYAAGYSVSRLVEHLEQRESLLGPQALEHRTGAWHRLLATTRALHGGIHHEDLRLPPYGGGLFDPGRFGWLEAADRVDDRTVLWMLRAVQYVAVGGERRRLSFRALDVEQIGYVYEGLLELEVRTAGEVTVGVARPRSGKNAWPRGKEPCEVGLSELVEWLSAIPPRLAVELRLRTARSESAVERDLVRRLDDSERQALRRVVGDDPGLLAVLARVAPLLHWYDDGTVPAVALPGRRFVAPSTRRAATGTHYTPRSLAEEVAGVALEALVYSPGPLETGDRSAWRIRSSTEILGLRVADIAMGSGAFLVAACRYLADRLVEAWVEEGRTEAVRAAEAWNDAVRAREAEQGRGAARLSADAEVSGVALDARRAVAEHCLYGVDVNPLAVEMAKLSLWLVTMDAERPFGFLDDRLVAGDSLLGLVDVRQIEDVHIDPERQIDARTGEWLDLGGYAWRRTLEQAAGTRRKITANPVTDVRSVEHKQRLLTQAHVESERVRVVADAITGVGLARARERDRAVDAHFGALRTRLMAGDDLDVAALTESARRDLQAGNPSGKADRVPLHWPVAFPEVFLGDDPGFDAIIGNPPFLGGQKTSGALGADYLAWLQRWDGAGRKGSADLAGRFVLRAQRLLNRRGQLGFITTNTLVQGDTLDVGLGQATQHGLTVRAARSSRPWPSGSANLEIVTVWASARRPEPGALLVLDGDAVPSIGADLEPVGRVAGRPHRLAENDGVAFQGSNVLGLGFTMSADEAAALIAKDPRNADCLQPYVTGQDLNQRPDHSASRWVINFRDWPLARSETYPDLIELVRAKVKPERDKNNRANYRDSWWRYGEHRPGLYAAIAGLDHVLAIARVSSTVMPLRVPTGIVYSEKCVIVATDCFGDLAALSSAAHTAWVVRYSSTMRTDINYAPSDVFLTLPRPQPTPELAALGERLDSRRRDLMLGRAWGLTTTYNAVHAPAVTDPEVVELREIHEAIDHAVLAAYGWSDLDPQVGHHPTKIGTRWTVSPTARFELLDRLLEENHRRHAEESR
jgi:hypothetical protein